MNESLCLAGGSQFELELRGRQPPWGTMTGRRGGSTMSERIGEAARDEAFVPLVSLSLDPQGAPVHGQLCQATVELLTRFWDERFASLPSEDERRPDALCAIFGFAVSELLENAFKFNQAGDIRVAVGVGPWEWGCRVSNQISSGDVSGLYAQLTELSRAEPGALLRRRAEANARHPERGTSGLGVLLMREYGVRLGWTLQPLSGEQIRVETWARLPLLAPQAWDTRWSVSR